MNILVKQFNNPPLLELASYETRLAVITIESFNPVSVEVN